MKLTVLNDGCTSTNMHVERRRKIHAFSGHTGSLLRRQPRANIHSHVVWSHDSDSIHGITVISTHELHVADMHVARDLLPL